MSRHYDPARNAKLIRQYRYNKWNRDHVLSFIPPDGRFKLLEYQVSEDVVAFKSLPITLLPKIKLEDNGGEKFHGPLGRYHADLFWTQGNSL